MTCPHCQTELEQLGTVQGPVENRYFVGENLWRCRECPVGKNRFTVEGGAAVPA